MPPEEYMIAGSAEFLQALKNRGVKLFVASGTDDADVKNEVAILGLGGYFDCIAGAPHRQKDCSKEAMIRGLMQSGSYAEVKSN